MSIFKKIGFWMLISCLQLFVCLTAEEKQEKGKRVEVAICTIFRNESSYLKEWIEFHKLVGVSRFYLYNNLSIDDYLVTLAPYILNGDVILTEWPYESSNVVEWNVIQGSAFSDGLEKAKKDKVQWLAFLDSDEFLMPVQTRSLIKAIRDIVGANPQVAAIGVNWQMYGTSWVPKIPADKTLIESLRYKAEVDYSENIHIKSIVRPELIVIKDHPNPHFFERLPGFFQVTENMQSFEGPFSPFVSVNKLKINHYWSRDEDFFYNVKLGRRETWNEATQNQLTRVENINKLVDENDVVLRFVKPLRKRLGLQ